MNENANIVTIKGETFYQVGERMLRPTPETEQNRAERRKYLKDLALEIVVALELAKVTYSEAREVLKMSEKEINYMSAHSLVSSKSDGSGDFAEV